MNKEKVAVLGEMVEPSLEWDELAYIVPMAISEELDALALDIQENGLREPILLWHGKVVDGRCRDLACTRIGERIRTKELDDDLSEEDVLRVVQSLNTRRNLSKTQKAMVGARNYMKDKSDGRKITINKAASRWGVSAQYIKDAIYLWNKCPEWAQLLFDGKAIDAGDDGKIYNIYQAKRLCKPDGYMDASIDNGQNMIDKIRTKQGVKEYERIIRNMNDISSKSEREIFIKNLVVEFVNSKWKSGE